jgi:hypothetical protein
MDWNNAPEWANWCAMDSDGHWFWFENKPLAHSSSAFKYWFAERSKFMFAFTSKPSDNWINTLKGKNNEH